MRDKIVATLVALCMISFAGAVLADDVSEDVDESSTLTVECGNVAPVLNVIDLRDSAGNSKLNDEIDVLKEYHFFLNITDNNSWEDIEYINITSWYDNGSDGKTNINEYNTTDTWSGAANYNMFLQYENTSGTASWSLRWPHNRTEATFNRGGEVETMECTREIKFSFTLGKQIRHTPGAFDGQGTYWAVYNNTRSWNFNVTIADTGGNRTYGYDEYGVYMYTEIGSVESPSMSGNPGDSVSASPIDIVTSSNGNFSLRVATDGELLHSDGKHQIDNSTCKVKGGDISATKLDPWPVYVYGDGTTGAGAKPTTYEPHQRSDTSLTTPLTYSCDIPLGTYPGTYTATLRYTLTTENN